MYGSSGYHLAAADRFSEGMRRLQAGEYHAAVYAFSAAISLDPHHWTAYFRRAEAHRELGLEEQADSDLEKAEFLMAAARQETAAKGASSEDAGTDLSGAPPSRASSGSSSGSSLVELGASSVATAFLFAAPYWAS